MTPSGIGVIVENYDHTFLLHLRDEFASVMKNEWCLIGGGRENEESWKDTAIREVKEESGLTFKEVVHIKDFMTPSGQQKSLFYGKVDTRVEKLTLGEGKELKFFHKENAIKHIESLPYTNVYLQQFLEHIGTL